jgi:membrane protease YdiL (CAAX protease family)
VKYAARLLVYFAATVLLGALLAPPLFWLAQWQAAHQFFPSVAQFDFESFFHRALLFAAILLLWPLLRSIPVRSLDDLELAPNQTWIRHLLIGFLMAVVPLLCCAAILLAFRVYTFRILINAAAFAKVIGATIAVPVIEELFFRGLVLGLLLRTRRVLVAIGVTSALYSIVHFLKAPEHISSPVTWASGFNSIAHSFGQFIDPVLVAGGFVTLFLIGLVLADARIRTRSLWFPIGLHAGWIFAAGIFAKIARRQIILLPWLGKNLLVGLIPIAIVCLTWAMMHCWLKRYAAPKV